MSFLLDNATDKRGLSPVLIKKLKITPLISGDKRSSSNHSKVKLLEGMSSISSLLIEYLNFLTFAHLTESNL